VLYLAQQENNFLDQKEGYLGAFTQYNGHEFLLKKMMGLAFWGKLLFAYDLLIKHFTKRPP